MTAEIALSEAVNDIQLRNTRLINGLRAAAAILFISTTLFIGYGTGQMDWRPGPLEYIYVAIAMAFVIGGETSRLFLRATRFAVPILDMPMVFLVQGKNMMVNESLDGSFAYIFSMTSRAEAGDAVTTTAGQVAEFSVSLFVCLLLLSALSISRFQIYLSLAVAAILQQWLHFKAGAALGPHLNSLIVFGLVGWLCHFAGRNRLSLVESVVRIEEHRNRLRRYFSPPVADLIEQLNDEGLGEGREVELTVIFVDIRDFTRLSETMTGVETVKLLNSFHSFLVESIFRHGGTLDKYLGDGLMAYFNAPLPQDDHAVKALDCALDIRRALVTLNEQRAEVGQPSLRLGIGIHTGPCVIGDVGAPHRREFTAIGQTVNLASRVESTTKEAGVDLLFSEATRTRIGLRDGCTEVGEFTVRGSSLPMRMHTVA